MKNKEKENFTKLTQKKGISLIVLIITIIVIIILSAVVIMTVSLNNPLSSAREAVFKEDISNFKTELEMYKAEMQVRKEKPENLNATKDTEPSIQDIITNMSDKYAKILEIKKGKLVYVGNNKAEYLLAYEMGMLPEDELLDDEIIEALQPFITEWTVSDNDSITLPVSEGECDFTVDYGDGTGEYKVTSEDDEDITHTYEKAGTYTVTIKGKCTSFIMSSCESKDKLTRLLQWGSTGFTSVNFASCTNLEGKIPGTSTNTFKNVTSFNYLFGDCPKLTGSIPENLFASATKVITFSYTFRRCTGLTGSIPENLFANCVKIKILERVFDGCSGLTGTIPENLFKNNTEVTSFGVFLGGCKGLTGTIPENLFKNNTEVTNFGGFFGGCTGLTGDIPENLFKNNSKVTFFSQTFYTCTGLTGNIPESLFSNCPEVTNFGWTFRNCKNLTGEIPENLFLNCSKATSFERTFDSCINLTGNAPALWERENVTSYVSCFLRCTNLSNYNEIPSSWGGGGT